jgi:predicted HTH transcriptional regulator
MITNYELLSRDARIQLLGHYCSKMVTLMHVAELEQQEIRARQAVETKGDGVTIKSQSSALTDDGKAIVQFLERVGAASPDDIRRYTGMSRMSVFRRLKELASAEILGKVGNGKSVRYRLVSKSECGSNTMVGDGMKVSSVAT